MCYTQKLDNLRPNTAFRVYKETLTREEYEFLDWLECALAQNKPFSECYNSETKKFEYGTICIIYDFQTWTIWNPYSTEFFDNVLLAKSPGVIALAKELLIEYETLYKH